MYDLAFVIFVMNSILKLAALFVLACRADHPQQTLELSKRLSEAYASSGDVVLRMNMDTYRKFAIDKPLNYHLFILFTANVQICRICKPFEDVFERVAQSYMASGKADVVPDNVPTFFAVVDIGPNNDIARLHKIETLPHILHYYGPKYTVSAPGADGVVHMPNRKFNIVKLDLKPQELLDWVNAESHNSVDLYYTAAEKLMKLATTIVALVALVFIAIKTVLLCRRKPIVIALVALFIHYIATSGLFYNILHGMQWAGVGHGGVPQYVFTGSRGQYLGEGLAMSALTVISGVSLFVASRLPYTNYAKKANPNHLTYVLLGLIVVSTASMYTVVVVYVMKMGWYSDASFKPPGNYRTGPLRVDQGNTF